MFKNKYEEKYKNLVENSIAGIGISKGDRLIFANNALKDIFGYKSLDELTDKLVLEHTAPESRDFIANRLKKRERGEYVSSTFDFKIIRNDGEIRDLEISSSEIVINNEKYIQSIYRDITERKKAEEELNNYRYQLEKLVKERTKKLEIEIKSSAKIFDALVESEKKYRHFLENLQDLAFEADIYGNIQYLNKAAEGITGVSVRDLIGRPLTYLYSEKSKKKATEIFKRLLNKESVEYEITHTDGEMFRYKTAPKQDKGGNVIGVFGIARNITNRIKAHRVLQRTEVQLRRLNATKDKFFSIIAHDLRSPFSSLLGFTKLLADRFDEYDVDKQKICVQNIYKSANKVYELLENLLVWSRSQRGRIEFNPQNENMYLLLANTLSHLNDIAEKKQIKIENNLSEDLIVKCDLNMISTVFRNIISNALKFTNRGGIIKIYQKNVTGKNDQKFIEITIEDNGVGIKPKDITKLFRISKSFSKPGTEKESGTGLGLILCKEFVTKHGGKIRAESQIDKGSKFIFSLKA